MTLHFDVCRCEAKRCKVKATCARWRENAGPHPKGHWVSYADFSGWCANGGKCHQWMEMENGK